MNIRNVSKEVFLQILFFIYTNSFSNEKVNKNNYYIYLNLLANFLFFKLEENLIYDVLQTADLYLLPGLKRKCASELASNHLSKENLFDFLRIARLYDLKKLEFASITFLAENLLEVS